MGCSFPGSRDKEGGRKRHSGHRPPIPVNFRGLWRVIQEGPDILLRTVGNPCYRAGSRFMQAEKQPPEKLLVQGRKGWAGKGKLIGLNGDGG